MPGICASPRRGLRVCGSAPPAPAPPGAPEAGAAPGSTTGGSQARPASPSSGPATALKTETTRAGQVLASSRGLTLYYYSEDKRGTRASLCTGACAPAWPPLAAPVKAPAGVHLPGTLG